MQFMKINQYFLRISQKNHSALEFQCEIFLICSLHI